jgi:hypothetical protein
MLTCLHSTANAQTLKPAEHQRPEFLCETSTTTTCPFQTPSSSQAGRRLRPLRPSLSCVLTAYLAHTQQRTARHSRTTNRMMRYPTTQRTLHKVTTVEHKRCHFGYFCSGAYIKIVRDDATPRHKCKDNIKTGNWCEV